MYNNFRFIGLLRFKIRESIRFLLNLLKIFMKLGLVVMIKNIQILWMRIFYCIQRYIHILIQYDETIHSMIDNYSNIYIYIIVMTYLESKCEYDLPQERKEDIEEIRRKYSDDGFASTDSEKIKTINEVIVDNQNRLQEVKVKLHVIIGVHDVIFIKIPKLYESRCKYL